MNKYLKYFFEYFIIKKSNLFDSHYYLLEYPDVRRSDTDPLMHFVKHGWKEGRNPNKFFEVDYYLEQNQDVKISGINPFLHYLRFGRNEGRKPNRNSMASHQVKYFSIKKTMNASNVNINRLKFFSIHVLKEIYQLLPLSINQRAVLKRFMIKIFPNFLIFTSTNKFMGDIIPNTSEISDLIPIIEVELASKVNGKIAIHLHIFYDDLILEFAKYLSNMPFTYDLYISVISEDSKKLCYEAYNNLSNLNKIVIKIVPNQGRDIAPLFCSFGEELKQYDYIGHFHTKKSLFNQGATTGWRDYLLDSLLGSEDQIRKIFSLINEKTTYGLIYPQTYFLVPYQAHTWLANKGIGEIWCSRLGFYNNPIGYFDFPAGSMFWIRSKALLPLLNAKISIEDFPKEAGQTDGTLAHALERLIAVSCTNSGMKLGILADQKVTSWSTWRLEQYTNRSYSDLIRQIKNPSIKLIGFDLFDTIFCRPLLEPESTKEIVARLVDEKTGNLYREFRFHSENQARILKGADVSLEDVFIQFSKMSGVSSENAKKLRDLEEEIEIADLVLRNGILQLYQEAISSNKKVVLISDTTLPKERLIKVLNKLGIDNWNDLFVSNDIGFRKDDSKLYEHIFKQNNIEPKEFLMIGDNERSDFQIPVDKGASIIHLMRPKELARGLPRLSHLIYEVEHNGNLDEEISLGLVVRKNFSSIYLENFDPSELFSVTPYNIGYSIVGPLLISFSNWLVKMARSDGVERIYFLSREGRIMKLVYDLWAKEVKDAPISDYLVLSRRSTTVPAISTFADIENIAKTTFFPNKVEKFLLTRFGLEFSKEKWADIFQNTGMKPESIIEIQNGNTGQVTKLLRYLEQEIINKSNVERISLLRYLDSKGLNLDNNQAVVDVGYSGTVQGNLIKLTKRKVNGYYLMTEDKSKNTVEKYQVLLKGCFEENVNSAVYMPIMFRDSFQIEKLLSSNDPQIEFYEFDEEEKPVEHFRPLTNIEIKSKQIRDEISEGCLKYAEDASKIRKTMLPAYDPQIKIAQALMEAFLSNLSKSEREFLSKIVLDDYYCGRDLVA